MLFIQAIHSVHSTYKTLQSTLAPALAARAAPALAPLRLVLTRRHPCRPLYSGSPAAMQGDVKYISPDEVAEMILAEPKTDDFLIIGAHYFSSSYPVSRHC